MINYSMYAQRRHFSENYIKPGEDDSIVRHAITWELGIRYIHAALIYVRFSYRTENSNYKYSPLSISHAQDQHASVASLP